MKNTARVICGDQLRVQNYNSWNNNLQYLILKTIIKLCGVKNVFIKNLYRSSGDRDVNKSKK